MLRLELLDARQGDAIRVSWGERSLTHQLLVDMGTPGLGKELWQQLANSGTYELLVVTHIDSDHIGGVVTCLVDQVLAGVNFKEVWFNGLSHATEHAKDVANAGDDAADDMVQLSPEQGAQFADWLQRHPRWNARFKGGAVCIGEKPRSFKLPGGLVITVLGPTRDRLDALAERWVTDMAAVIEDVEELGSESGESSQEPVSDIVELGAPPKQEAPSLRGPESLQRLAANVTGDDSSPANGSSIVLLLEHGKHAVLLAGDAFAADLVSAIRKLGRKAPLRLDALKLPHHGSRKNVTRELIRAINCPLFLFSTNGTQFQHPDNEAVACVICHAQRRPVHLGFNYKSDNNRWWSNARWQRKYGYVTTYGTAGRLTITFPRKVPSKRVAR